MTQIILTQDQAKLLLNAREPVEFCDAKGTVLARVLPEDAAWFKQAKERTRSPGPWFTTTEVLQHLHALQQVSDREGGLDSKRMHELLNEMQQEGNR